MPTHIRGFRGPMQLHWSANPRRGRKPVNEAVKHPRGGRTYRGRANECPRTFAGFVNPRSDIGPRRGFCLAKNAVRGWLKRFSTEKTIPPWDKSGKAKVISTASNFRMSAAPINSYPGIHAGAPLFCNYNGRSKEGIDFLDF